MSCRCQSDPSIEALEQSFEFVQSSKSPWDQEESFEIDDEVNLQLPDVLSGQVVSTLIKGYLWATMPALAMMLTPLSSACVSAGITLGIGTTGGASIVSPSGGGGVAGSAGLVILPRPGAFGVYGSLSAIPIAFGTPSVGAKVSATLQAVYGDESVFSGLSHSLGGSVALPGYPGVSVSMILSHPNMKVIGGAVEIDLQLGTDTGTGAVEAFIAVTKTVVISDRGISQEINLERREPRSVRDAIKLLKKRGVGTRQVKKAMRSLDIVEGPERRKQGNASRKSSKTSRASRKASRKTARSRRRNRELGIGW